MTRISIYGLLIVVGLMGAIGDATLNHWATTNRHWWLFVSYGLWIGVASLFGFILKYEEFTFSAAVVLALLVHSVAAMGIDRMFFGGKLSTWEWAGIACACAAITFMEMGRASAKEQDLSKSVIEANAERP